MIKAMIFDFDGTLAYTLEEIAVCANMALKLHCYNEVSIENVKKYIGDGSINLISRAMSETWTDFSSLELKKVHSDYLDIYKREEGKYIKEFPFVKETLLELNKRGVKLAVLSNKPTANVVAGVKNTIPDVDFQFIYGDGEGFPLKPNPESMHFIMEKMGVSKEETAYIGDGDADVTVAINAGVKGISATWGYRTKDQLESVGATNFISDIRQLLDI